MTRVLVTSMGGELGTRVTLLLEADPSVTEIVGMDIDPPRRRLRRSTFHRLDPRDRRKVVAVVRDFAPQAVVHLGIYEPDARSSPRYAAEQTSSGTLAVLGAAAESGALERVVVRSGIEVYGRRRGSATVPAEDVPPDPTSRFGCMLLETERVAAAAGRTAGAPVAALRFAPLAGPHFPSPFGRVLRLPAVPFEVLADPAFSLLHQEDAATAVIAALKVGFDGPVNVVGQGAVTAAQAARVGKRVPLPVTGPGWSVVRRAVELLGAPMPDHVVEMFRRGRAADGGSVVSALAFQPEHPTLEVVKAMFEWAPVTPIRLATGEAA